MGWGWEGNFTPTSKRTPKKLKKFTQSAFTCTKLTTETLEQGVKYIQS